jgi:hypothetical protein
MKGYIYAIIASVLLVSLVGNKVLYDAGARKAAEIKMLSAEITLREKEAKTKDEVNKRHAKLLEESRAKMAKLERGLETALTTEGAWSSVRVPSAIIDGLLGLAREAGGDTPPGEPAARTRPAASAGRSNERRFGALYCRPAGNYLAGELGQAVSAGIL